MTARDVIREHSDRFATRALSRGAAGDGRPIYTAKETGTAKTLATKITGGLPVLCSALDAFFTSADGWWVQRNAFGLNVFASVYSDMIMRGGTRNGVSMDIDAKTRGVMEIARRVLQRHDEADE